MEGKEIQEAAAILAAAKKKQNEVTQVVEKTKPKERFRGIKILIIISLFSLAGYFFWAGSNM